MKAEMKWQPEHFELERTSVWDFPNRGKWAGHNGSYPGNWSPYVPRNVILRYSRESDVVLDQFVGGGTTMVEAALLNRRGIGLDINTKALHVAQCHMSSVPHADRIQLLQADARNLTCIGDESIDLICTHPPYANMIKYGGDDRDLSGMRLETFLNSMTMVAQESLRVLRPGRMIALMMGDMRRAGRYIALADAVMHRFVDRGFQLENIVIKTQHNTRTTRLYWSAERQLPFLLLAHEYLFLFSKIVG
ncbi:MAG: TRM11 family SAM-dependent methyltransferase [Bifidobacterium asteroides]